MVSHPIDVLTLRAAFIVVEALEALDNAIADAKVGEIYVAGELALEIDGHVQAHIRRSEVGDWWDLVPEVEP